MKDLSLRSVASLALSTGVTSPSPAAGERALVWSTTENRFLQWNGTFWLPLYSGVVEVVASEALSAGDIVNLWSNTGTANVRKADNATGKAAHGFVVQAYSGAATAHVCTLGDNLSLSGMTVGQVYLGTSGGVTSTPPSAAGSIVQDLGFAVSASKLLFQRGIPITIS